MLGVVLPSQAVNLDGELGVELRETDLLPRGPVFGGGALDDLFEVPDADRVIGALGSPVADLRLEPSRVQRFDRLQDFLSVMGY